MIIGYKYLRSKSIESEKKNQQESDKYPEFPLQEAMAKVITENKS